MSNLYTQNQLLTSSLKPPVYILHNGGHFYKLVPHFIHLTEYFILPGLLLPTQFQKSYRGSHLSNHVISFCN